MRLSRDCSGAELAKRLERLERLGYTVSRQAGSHIRLTTQASGEHHITVPNHDPLRIGTLAAILAEVAGHHGLAREELFRQLFG
jgi:predicted RNA binding protein YcfA (HicA-like mRNA interferase family)